ncbi:MarR family winged helix-turn-helix transcriptional regulator [Aurantiacibacter poecillastricola]|uniref:MarR family winged helix-turn-helix transcriptional regulator n=1 Tax=Aurantiacibacter poecillastricola TaxID=3064385 RepID=UPI00273E46B4|nr:MarR family winged helix-turn-helix transcriptional regulator [Aurantiacibacter sp. 219JJ12-13]MDP5263595.1 MarR family winged helix-turn-helix transcriptional regulator [Aurantiacibacter sp. 219JJ12-13]
MLAGSRGALPQSEVAEPEILPAKPRYIKPQDSAGYQVRRAHRRFDRLLSAFLSQHGLKTGHWYYLRVLWNEDGVTQKYLSDMTNVAENTTATLINSMVQEGLVTRQRDPHDRRKFAILLTERGRALESELMGYAAQINAIAGAGIDQTEIDTCLSVLERMSGNLAQAFGDLQKGTAASEG